MKRELRLLIFRDCDWWVAQFLEYDIAAQARTLPDVQYEIQRALIGRIVIAKKLGIDPFENLAPAPAEYHQLFKDTSKTLRVELRPVKNFPKNVISFPKEAMLYA